MKSKSLEINPNETKRLSNHRVEKYVMHGKALKCLYVPITKTMILGLKTRHTNEQLAEKMASNNQKKWACCECFFVPIVPNRLIIR